MSMPDCHKLPPEVKRSFIRSLVLVAVLAVLVVVGFVVLDRGRQQSDASSVSEVVKSYDAALADGEGDAACSLLTAEAARRVARQHGYGGTLRIDATRTRATCPDGIENRYLGEDAYFEELKFAPISDVEVRGQDARATIDLGGSSATAVLRKTATGWRLSVPPLP
jgi:hypothetical protein